VRRRVLTASALAGVVLIGGGGVAYAQMTGSSGSYRTAIVSTGNVDKTMNLSGTVTSSSRRDLSFGTSGQVTKVSVAAGDTVHAGETLAKIDDTDLKNAVTKATATLDSAEAKLESDESSQSSTVASAASTPSTSSKSSSPSSGSGSSKGSKPDPAVTKALAEVKKQQLAVTTAQTDATTAITAAKAALEAQKTACADDDTSTDPSDPPATGLSAACTTALDAVQAAQDDVATKQDALQSALQTLSKTLDAAIAAVQKASSTAGSSTGSTGGGSSSGSGSSSSSGSTGSTGSTGSSSSAGRTSGSSGGSSASSLAEDQAAIDTAKAQLTEAKLAVDSATLTAPYEGRILSVSIAKGDDVGSSDVVMVLVGDGGTTATTTVTADQVASIKKGQTAEVTPAGADKPVTGTVTSIGLLPDSSSSTVTYPVTIDLADGVTAPEGTTASIAVITGTAKNVLTIPSSALTKIGTRAIVQVLKNGAEVPTVVTVGVVGSTRTSITDGLTKGQTVVIADLNASLPSGGTTTNTRFGGGANFVRPGGAGGGGFGGGGAGGRG
jgi:HlyD family secretion protein